MTKTLNSVPYTNTHISLLSDTNRLIKWSVSLILPG